MSDSLEVSSLEYFDKDDVLYLIDLYRDKLKRLISKYEEKLEDRKKVKGFDKQCVMYKSKIDAFKTSLDRFDNLFGDVYE